MADTKDKFTVNNVAYSWSMIELTCPKLTGANTSNPLMLQGVTGLKWNKKWNVKTNYGLGGKPVNRGFGNWEYTASITMDYNTQVQLRAGYDSLTSIGEFDLVVSFGNAEDIVDFSDAETITLEGCIFSEDGMEVSQDDTTITKEFDLNPFNIKVERAA